MINLYHCNQKTKDNAQNNSITYNSLTKICLDLPFIKKFENIFEKTHALIKNTLNRAVTSII